MKYAKKHCKSFSLIELLVVIAIIGMLASIILVSVGVARKKAYNASVKAGLRAINQALEMYNLDHNQYPCDVSRDLPAGLEQYLTTDPNWPKAPWPGSVFDWEYWSPNPGATGGCAGSLAQDPKTQPVYQISIRFCDISGGNCHFPDEAWATTFDSQSSAYWCVAGPCRAHGNEDYHHPGCCIGGSCPADQPTCGF